MSVYEGFRIFLFIPLDAVVVGIDLLVFLPFVPFFDVRWLLDLHVFADFKVDLPRYSWARDHFFPTNALKYF